MGNVEATPTRPSHENDLGFTLDDVAQFGVVTPASFRRFLSPTKLKEIVQSVFFGTVYGQYLFLATLAITLLISGTIAWTFGSVGTA